MFGRKPQITIIFVADREVFRFDFDRQFTAPVFQCQFSIDAESQLAQSVQLVVSGQPRVAAKVVVISASVWSQILLLPSLSVQGISNSELGEALKYEAETLSGLEIDDIAVSFLAGERTEEQQKYWVSVFSQLELNQLNQILLSAGARIINVIHPAGADRKEARLNRQRVESWGRSEFIFDAGKPILGRVGAVGASLELEPDAEWVIGRDNELTVRDAVGSTQQLGLEEELLDWIVGVAQVFSSAELPLVPVLQVARKTVAAPMRHLVSIALALAIAGFCVWHWMFLSSQNRHLQAEIIKIQEPGKKKKEYDSELRLIAENRNKILDEAAEVGDQLKRVQFFVDNQKNRFALLLDLLVDLRTPDLVINNIGGTEEGVVISGISLNGESAQAFAKRLRENAVGIGWVVNPAKQEGRQQMTSGGPWDFEILLSDTGPFEKTVSAVPRKSPTPGN